MQLGSRTVRTAFFAALAAALILLLLSLFTVARPAPPPGETLAWEEGWRLSQKQDEALSLPAKLPSPPEGEGLRLYSTLPAAPHEGQQSLYIKTNYQRVWVELDGVPLQVAGNWGENGALSLGCASPWSAVLLPEGAGGGQLTLILGGHGSKRAPELYRVLLGDAEAIQGNLLRESLPVLAACVTAALLALGFLLLAPLLSARYREALELGLNFLAAFLLLTALWVFTDSDIQAVFFLGSQAFFVANLFSYMLLPIPFMFFVRSACRQGERWIEGMCAVDCLFFLLNAVSMLLGRFSLAQTLTVSHVLALVSIAVVLLATGRDHLSARRSEVAEIFFGMSALALFTLAQLAVFYLLPFARNTAFFAFGALAFLLVQAVGALRRAFVLIERSKSFQSLIEAIPAGICRLRCGGALEIELANDFYYHIFDYTRAEALAAGFTSVDFIVEAADLQSLHELIAETLREGREGFEAELRHRMRDGSRCWVLTRGRIDRADPRRITASVIDITDRKRADEQLRVSEEEYRIAVAHSGKMIHRYDIASRTLYLSAASARLLGLPSAELRNIPENPQMLALLGEECISDYRAFFARIHRGEREGTTVIRRRTAGGRWCWHRIDYTLIRDAAARPATAVVTFEDVSEEHERELVYKRWQQDYSALPPQSNNYYEYNLTADVFEREEGAMLPRVPKPVPRSLSAIARYTAENCVFPEDRRAFLDFYSRERLLACYARELRADSIHFRRLDEQGNELWTSANIQLVADPYSSDVKAFLLLQDIDREKRAELERQARSSRDALTGLYNREAFIERFGERLAAREPETFCALAIVDIDLFKTVNDTRGHQAGDAVLAAFGKRLRAELSSDELGGRLGGDEFFLALFASPDASALQSRLQQLCDSLRREYLPELVVTASLGAACCPRDGSDFPTLYRHADQALYEAKRQGKDRALLFTPAPPDTQNNT